MSRRPRRDAGFTLIELLVAVAVFALVAAIAYTALSTLSNVADDYRQRSEQLADLQRAVVTMDADLRQLLGRRGRDRDGRLLPAMQGDRDALLARRAGRANPAGLQRSELQQVRWLSRADGLVREAWPEVDSPPSSAPSGRTLYPTIEALAFRFRDASGVWHAQWPAGREDALPSAVEYVLETERFGRVRRLVLL